MKIFQKRKTRQKLYFCVFLCVFAAGEMLGRQKRRGETRRIQAEICHPRRCLPIALQLKVVFCLWMCCSAFAWHARDMDGKDGGKKFAVKNS
jgi:hypothetical protein